MSAKGFRFQLDRTSRIVLPTLLIVLGLILAASGAMLSRGSIDNIVEYCQVDAVPPAAADGKALPRGVDSAGIPIGPRCLWPKADGRGTVSQFEGNASGTVYAGVGAGVLAGGLALIVVFGITQRRRRSGEPARSVHVVH